jgi:hypothetical protein
MMSSHELRKRNNGEIELILMFPDGREFIIEAFREDEEQRAIDTLEEYREEEEDSTLEDTVMPELESIVEVIMEMSDLSRWDAIDKLGEFVLDLV